MSTISSLMLRRGDIEAQGHLNRGASRGATVSALAGFLPGVQARRAAQYDAEQAAFDRDLDRSSKISTIRNTESQITARDNQQMDEAAARDLARTTAEVNDWLTSVAGLPDLEAKKAAYEDGRQRLVAAGRLQPTDAPGMFPGDSWVKSRLTMLLPAQERFKQLFPEPEAPGAANMRGLQIMKAEADLMSQEPVDHEWVVRSGQPLQIPKGTAQPGDRPYQPPSQAQPDYEWVVRGGQPMQIRKGTAQSGDRPYDATAATSAPSPYLVERAQRTVQAVDDVMGQVTGWSAGWGSKLQSIPSTDAKALSAQLKTVASNIAFSELTAMREASKTGGALGAVSDRELTLLSSVVGAMDQEQDPAVLRGQLQKIRDSIVRWYAAQGVDLNAGGGTTPTAGGGRGAGGGPGPASGGAPTYQDYLRSRQGAR